MLIKQWESEKKEEMLYKFSAPYTRLFHIMKKKDDMKIFSYEVSCGVAKQCVRELFILFYLSRELSGSGVFYIFHFIPFFLVA